MRDLVRLGADPRGPGGGVEQNCQGSGHRWFRVWLLSGSLLVSLGAWAGVPDYPGPRTVLLVPEQPDFRRGSIEKALSEAEIEANVVVLADVRSGGKGAWRNGTERALEEIWQGWSASDAASKAGFDAERGVLLVLSMDEEELRLQTGSFWGAELGLTGAALTGTMDQVFMPRARAGDRQGGLAALIAALDERLGAAERSGREMRAVERLVPVEDLSAGLWERGGVDLAGFPESELVLADKPLTVLVVSSLSGEAGPASGAVQAAALLRATEGWAGVVRPKPTRVSAFVLLDAQSGRASWRGGDALAEEHGEWRLPVGAGLDAALAARLQGLVARLEKAQQGAQAEARRRTGQALSGAGLVAKQAREAAVSRRWWQGGLLGLGGALALLGLGAWGAATLRKGRAEATKLRELLVPRRAELERAKARLADLNIEVDAPNTLARLRARGVKTKTLLHEVEQDVSVLIAGVNALDRRLSGVEHQAESWLTEAKRLALAASLDADIEVDTAEVSRRLFGEDGEAITVPTQAFMDELDARFARAITAWEQLGVDAELSLKDVEDLADDATVIGCEARLRAAGLPISWVDHHPLRPDADLYWAQLDHLRREDLAGLRAAVAAVNKANAEVLAITGQAITLNDGVALAWEPLKIPTRLIQQAPQSDRSGDPVARREAVRISHGRVMEALKAGHDLGRAEQLAKDFIRESGELDTGLALSNPHQESAATMLRQAELGFERMVVARDELIIDLTEFSGRGQVDPALAAELCYSPVRDLQQAGLLLKEHAEIEATAVSAEVIAESAALVEALSYIALRVRSSQTVSQVMHRIFTELRLQRMTQVERLARVGLVPNEGELEVGDEIVQRMKTKINAEGFDNACQTVVYIEGALSAWFGTINRRVRIAEREARIRRGRG